MKQKTVGILVSFAGVPISENKIKQIISLFGKIHSDRSIKD